MCCDFSFARYGVLRQDKLEIGRAIIRPLLTRVINNLESGLEPHPKTRVWLYFSSESHIHALRNIFLLAGLPANKTVLFPTPNFRSLHYHFGRVSVKVATALEATELCYLSHGVLRLYEDPNKEEVPSTPAHCLPPTFFIFSVLNRTIPTITMSM